MSMERQAMILKHRAKKRMYAEYETCEPSLRRVLGHCAVYHFASYIIETEEMIAAQLEESSYYYYHYTEEEQGWSNSSCEDEDEAVEVDQTKKSEDVRDLTTTLAAAAAASPHLTAIDQSTAATILLQKQQLESLCDEIEFASLNYQEKQMNFINTRGDSTNQMTIITPNESQHRPKLNLDESNSDRPNPLRSHPPTPKVSCKVKDNYQYAHQHLTTKANLLLPAPNPSAPSPSPIKTTNDQYTDQMILQLIKSMYHKVLMNLHPKSPTWLALPLLEEEEQQQQQQQQQEDNIGETQSWLEKAYHHQQQLSKSADDVITASNSNSWIATLKAVE